MSVILRHFPAKLALLTLIFIFNLHSAQAQTTLTAGDLAFVGYITADDGVNGVTQDDEFSFILLTPVTSGTIINFTDFGWLTAGGFQTANPCGANTGAINDGIIRWTSTSALPCGTQVRIKCKYGLTATTGTVTGIQACNNDAAAYLSLAIAGDQIFAYQGLHATPTLIAGISLNKAWDASLVNCFFSSNSSVLPAALASANNVAITSGINAKYNCSTTNNLPSVLIPAINNTANWNTDNTFAPPVPVGFSLPLSCGFSCVPGPAIFVSSVTGTISACLGSASANPNVQQFTVSGSLLTNDIVLTAPANFEISTSIGSGYGASVTLTQTGGNVASTTIYVRSAASAPLGAISGNVGAVSSPAPSQNAAVSGTVNPIPNAVATPASQSICSGSAITTVVLSGAVGSTTYNWSRDNTASVTGIAASGSGNISGSLTNTTNAPVTVTFTITPTANGCTGTPITATVTVNPVPDAVATPSTQTICAPQAITTIVLSGAVSGTTFNWTRDNTAGVTGIAASGSGNISGTLTNTTNAPVTVTFTITPVANGCSGTPITATVVVNITPDVVATPASQAVCSGLPITAIVLSGAVTGTTFSWTRDNTGTVTGLANSGTGDISGTAVNNTGSPVTVTYTITPSANGCTGTSITATVTVNPRPNATITGGGLTTCQSITTTLSAPADPNYTYNWGRSFLSVFTTVGTAQTLPVTASGFYKLTVTDANGCSNSSTTLMNVADYVFSGTLTAGDPTQTGRLNRFANISTCAAPKTCPGLFATTGSRAYDVYTVSNPRSVPVCATIGLNSSCGTNIFAAAYSSFDPANLCTNYLADPGSSPATSIFFEVTVPANSSIDIVVHEVNPGQGCTGYNLTVDMPRETPAAITGAPASAICAGTSVTLTASPAASYSWSPGGQTTQSITVNPSVTTNYTVTLGYGNNGCTPATASATITVNPLPVVNISGGGLTTCQGVTTTLSGPVDPTYSYAWEKSYLSVFTTVGTSANLPVTSSGFYRLKVTDANGCIGTSAPTIMNVADYVFTGSLTPGDPTQTGRLNRFANISTCAAPKTCPGTFTTAGARAYDKYTVSNPRPVPVCAVVGLNSGCGTALFAVAYSSFDPLNLCANYLADPGSSPATSIFFEVTIPANSSIDLVVHEVNPGQGCSAYTLTVDMPRDPAAATPVPASINCGGSSTITASVANSYLWSPGGQTTQSIVVSPLTTTNYSVTLGYGNNGCTATANTTVTVVSTPPTISCPGNITLANTVGQCGRIVSYTTTAGGTPAPAVTYTFTGATTGSGSGDGSGSFFNKGTTTVTVTATNACGSASCSFTVTINDTEAPSITCPVPVTVSCAALVPAVNTAAVTATDNCPGVVVTHIGDVISNQTCVNRFTVTRTYRATDASGNFAECTQIITVNDVTAPTITCPAPVTVSCAAAVPAVNIAAVIATDNCAGTVVVTHISDVISNQTCLNRYTLTRTYRATDACGNFAECTQIITVNDQTAPVITCPAPVTVSCAAAVPAPNTALVTATDNCAGPVVITWISDVISGQTCANRYLVTRTYRATDACGNFAECTQTITVNDVTPPVITCPAPVTVSCASAVPAPNIALVTATDNCAGVVTVTWISDVISGQTCANRYLVTRTYRATDVCGNFAECTQTITVNDVTPPVITCPAPVTVSCASAVPAPNVATVTATDNCAGVVTVTWISDVISGQTCPNRYTITRTYRATDVCGNFAQCTQTITVNDQTAPVLTCPANINVLTPIGSCTAVVNFTPTATDNCNGAVTIVSVPASGSVFPIGTTTVNVTATDACGNSSSCSFTVTVVDAQLPVISQQPVTRFVCDGANASFTVVSTNALSYQWQQWNGSAWTNIAGATSATLTINAANFTQNTNTYRVAVIGLCTTVQSASATLYVNPLPVVTVNTSIPPFLTPGQSLNLLSTVNPVGGSYRWTLNGTLVSTTGPNLNGITIDGQGAYRLTYTDPNGCVNNSAEIVVVGQQSNGLWVYPNPNQGSFNVRFFNRTGEKVTVNVLDAKGARVFSREFVTSNSYSNMVIDLAALGMADGTYIVNVVSQEGKIVGSRKILVYRR